jgi:hypothetical protein
MHQGFAPYTHLALEPGEEQLDAVGPPPWPTRAAGAGPRPASRGNSVSSSRNSTPLWASVRECPLTLG